MFALRGRIRIGLKPSPSWQRGIGIPAPGPALPAPKPRSVPPLTPSSAPSRLGPPRPEGLLSTSGRRPAARSASAFAHVVRLGLSPRLREWGRVGARPTSPGGGGWGLPDSRERAGWAGREDEGGAGGTGEVRGQPGGQRRLRLSAGGAGA